MIDPYKSIIIQDHIREMADNEHYQVRLKSNSGKTINLDENALLLLYAYYNGKISDDEIAAMNSFI